MIATILNYSRMAWIGWTVLFMWALWMLLEIYRRKGK